MQNLQARPPHRGVCQAGCAGGHVHGRPWAWGVPALLTGRAAVLGVAAGQREWERVGKALSRHSRSKAQARKQKQQPEGGDEEEAAREEAVLEDLVNQLDEASEEGPAALRAVQRQLAGRVGSLVTAGSLRPAGSLPPPPAA